MQTARDGKSGETSHNAQERMGSIMPETARVIREETPSESDHAQQLKKTAPSVKKEVEAGASKDQEAEEKKHNFRFRLKAETYSVVCKTSMTVLEALNTSKLFRIEKDKPKEILIQRSNGKVPRAAVKSDFPCCLIEGDEILDITFVQKDRNSSTNQQTTADPSLLSKRSKPETLVTFSVEKEGGPKVTCLLKSAALRENVRHVCVFALKGEKIKTALKRDGRFNDVIFKKHCALSESVTETKHEFSLPVDDLDKKTFQVVVISDNNQPESQEDDVTHVKPEPNEASDAEVAENGPNQNPINTEQEKKQDGNTTKSTNPSTKRYVAKPIDNSEKIAKILRDQFKDLLEMVKQREKLKDNPEVLKFFREEYHKSVENFLEVKKVKKLMKLSDSVCQIRVGGTAVGTGFLLFDRFILTNAHVIGISSELTPENVTQYTAVFDYQDMDSEVKRIPVKQLVAFCYGKDDGGRHLDYALLELVSGDEIAKYLEMDSVEEIAESPKLVSVEEIAQYPKLLSSYSPNPPNKGHIWILGHPGEGVKKMDPCFIIERENRLEAADKHASENMHLIHVMMEVYKEQKWDFSAYENKFTYDSCFFHGSSGSPVFDKHCKLIGVHSGGYVYPGEKGKTRSVMEYGFTMQPILESISSQAKIKGFHEIVNALKPYINKSKVSADQQNQTDCEMVDAKEVE